MFGVVHRFSVIAVMLGLMGCATMNSQPGWVNGEIPAAYPKDKFITALATGNSLETAKIAAKTELSSIFSLELVSVVKIMDQESTVDGQSTSSSDLEEMIRLATAGELQGVEVPLHWRDPKTGIVWALAILERRKECLRIRTEGGDLLTRLDGLDSDSRTHENPLLVIRAALQAVEVGAELDILQARSRVLGSQCLTARSVGTGALKTRVDRELSRLSFVVTANEVDARSGKSIRPLPQLRERIADNLSEMGFQVGPSRDASVVAVNARLRLSRVQRGTDWIEYRWEGSAEIGSAASNTPAIIAVESDGAESHPEDSTARLRARIKGEQEIAHQLDRLLKAFLSES